MIAFKRSFPWLSWRSVGSPSLPPRQLEPLREFVYLDEVSLASLLASQKGELTENTTSQTGSQLDSEIGSKISANSPVGPSAEVQSRFQTTNSTSLQTVRKANAQSLFRELHKLDFLRKMKPVEVLQSAKTLEEAYAGTFAGAVYHEQDLHRGDLLEVKVKLSASWIFQISTMVAEFSEMFDENPVAFMKHVNFLDIYQAKQANKIIGKLLAGLIPVDGVVSDYVVVEEGGKRHVAHRDIIRDLDVPVQLLRIVGVTEHLAYWKDIRRVLFSENEFTVLCRLSQSGIQSDWNPIKASDIFKDFAPDLAHQIESATRLAMLQSAMGQVNDRPDIRTSQMALALVRYKDILLGKSSSSLSEEQLVDLDRHIAEVPIENDTAEGQRASFAIVKDLVVERTGLKIDPDSDLRAREKARSDLNLPLFSLPRERSQATISAEPCEAKEDKNYLLDVEVVAIYW